MKRWLVLILAALIPMLALATSAAGPAIARPDPPLSTVNEGELFVVNLYVQDVAGMYGADIHLNFDPTLLEVQDSDPSTPGVQIQPASSFFAPGFVIKRKACNQVEPADPDCGVAGLAWYAAVQLYPAAPVTGSGPVAAITFKAVRPGVSLLSIDYEHFSDSSGAAIPSTHQDGAVKVVRVTPGAKLYLPVLHR